MSTVTSAVSVRAGKWAQRNAAFERMQKSGWGSLTDAEKRLLQAGVAFWQLHSYDAALAKLLVTHFEKINAKNEMRNQKIAALESSMVKVERLRAIVEDLMEQRTQTVFVKSETAVGESALLGRVEALEERFADAAVVVPGTSDGQGQVDGPLGEKESDLRVEVERLRGQVQKLLTQRTRTVFVKSETALGDSELVPRIAALEEKSVRAGVHWAGTYRTGETYPEGCLVTRSGALWLAMRPTSDVPGQGASSWKLIVKSGDAR